MRATKLPDFKVLAGHVQCKRCGIIWKAQPQRMLEKYGAIYCKDCVWYYREKKPRGMHVKRVL